MIYYVQSINYMAHVANARIATTSVYLRLGLAFRSSFCFPIKTSETRPQRQEYPDESLKPTGQSLSTSPPYNCAVSTLAFSRSLGGYSSLDISHLPTSIPCISRTSPPLAWKPSYCQNEAGCVSDHDYRWKRISLPTNEIWLQAKWLN